MSEKSVLLIGATGLVGQECLKLLLADDYFSRIVVLTRKPLDPKFQDGRLQNYIINFDKISTYKEYFQVTHVISALGTTIKKAGSRENFLKIDMHYTLDAAKTAFKCHTSHFLLVSALGADSSSRVFYNRVKGELEDRLRAIGFDSLSIFRPSLLLGKRKEFRLGEEVGKVISGIFSFAVPEKYKPVEASDLASAIVKTAKQESIGLKIIESDEIRLIAKSGYDLDKEMDYP